MKKLPTSESKLSNISQSDNKLDLTASSEKPSEPHRSLFKISKLEKQLEPEVKTSILSHFKIGNTFCFFYFSDTPLITISTKCVRPILAISLILIMNISFIFYIAPIVNYILRLLCFFVFLAQLITHLVVLTLSQGIPSRKMFLSKEIIKKVSSDNVFNTNFNFEKYQVCKHCSVLLLRDSDVVHCFECGVCCIMYDHHCYWIGKCVGSKNMRAFKSFLFMTLTWFFTLLGVLGYSLFLLYLK